MISQQELPGYIEDNLPELSGICKKNNCRNTYDIVRQMIAYTGAQIAKRNIASAKKCLSVADQLHKKGNKIVKNAIENVFVYSFSHAFLYDDNKKKELLELVPVSLYELYKNQVVNSHL